jgi:iron complex outermembrane receptor protein
MLRIMVTMACCGLSVQALAQFTVIGTVRGTEKKEVLVGATVGLKTINKFSVTDRDGKFTLAGVPAGTYPLTISFLGFLPFTKTITVDGNLTVDAVLMETSLVTEEVIISATRANENSPTTYTNVSKETIEKQNFGQDVPFLLNWTPSLVTTSDAGAGVGYTGLRIRGSDATHINVTINGIPYNDSESQGTYWVDIPDIASSTQSIQLQRGVGTSTNGAGAFGGSVNLQTNSLRTEPYTEISTSYGSFNTQKYNLQAGTGLINNVWAFDGRVSKIQSDGYIERAFSDLGSYYLSGGYYGKKTLIKAIMFGGHEQTYQSWYGTDPARVAIDRRFNYAGAIYDAGGNVVGYYNNQTDNYWQDHYQVHFAHRVNDYWNLNAAVHYTYGRGYYEEYLQNQTYAGLGLPNVIVQNDTIRAGDFIRRQWLDNKFYGTTYSARYSKGPLDFTLGGALNRYGHAKHWGEIIWAQYAGPITLGQHYYDALSQKTDFNVFAKLNYDLSEKLNGYIDLQYRQLRYVSSGINEDDLSYYSIDDNFFFFNPKAGLSYTVAPKDVLYTSFGVAHREPTRADYLAGLEKPKSEELGNLEAGWRRKTPTYSLEANYYLMEYKDQLVLTGQLNSVGYPIRANVGKSYRTGIELSGTLRISDKISWGANATWSKNKNKELVIVNADNAPVAYHNTDIILSPDWIAASQLAWMPIKKFQVTLLSKYVGTQYLDNTQSESVRLDSYFVNDIRFSYTFTPSFIRAIDIGFLFNNIFNTLYSSNGAVYSGVPYYYPQAGRNFLSRVTLKF